MVRNLKITLAYDGSEFHGWQVQPGRPTVQAALAAALERVAGCRELPQGSGRTDAGVHALAQVASVRIASPIPLPNLLVALNDVLPPSVRVLKVERAAPRFHARASAKAKTYRYRIWRRAIRPPFLARYVTHHPYPLNIPAMWRAARLVVGRHDFTSFAAVDPEERPQERSHVRRIFSSRFRRTPDELIYEVRGDGFLHHMVRNLVGTFLLVGKGTLQPSDIPRIVKAKKRSAAGPTAPPEALYLVSVEY